MASAVPAYLVLGTVWLCFAQPALSQGTILFTQPATPIVLFTRGFAQFYPLDVDNDGNPDFVLAYDFHFIGVQPQGANRVLTLLDPPPNVGGSVAPLPYGFSIGQGSEAGSLAWYSGAPDYNTLIQCFDVGCAGAFNGQHAYMGLEFQHAGATHYGWALLTIATDQPAGQIESWAWDTGAGASILAGAVPEPSTPALLLVFGVAFWLLHRRRGRKPGAVSPVLLCPICLPPTWDDSGYPIEGHGLCVAGPSPGPQIRCR